jgi:hypothetical protein
MVFLREIHSSSKIFTAEEIQKGVLDTIKYVKNLWANTTFNQTYYRGLQWPFASMLNTLLQSITEEEQKERIITKLFYSNDFNISAKVLLALSTGYNDHWNNHMPLISQAKEEEFKKYLYQIDIYKLKRLEEEWMFGLAIYFIYKWSNKTLDTLLVHTDMAMALVKTNAYIGSQGDYYLSWNIIESLFDNDEKIKLFLKQIKTYSYNEITSGDLDKWFNDIEFSYKNYLQEKEEKEETKKQLELQRQQEN